MIRKVCLFRHGQTDWNLEGRFQGHIDVPLNKTGQKQALELVPSLRAQSVEAILSSDLSRAWETARIVASELRIPMYGDPGLREADLGKAAGLLREEIEERFGPAVVHRWKSALPTDADVAYEGGESGRQVTTRVFAVLEGFLINQSYERVGVATHGGVIRRVMQKVLPPESEPVPIPNGVMYVLEFDIQSRKWSYLK